MTPELRVPCLPRHPAVPQASRPSREDLTLVLVVASVTPTLRDELQRMGWTLTPLGGGYARIDGVLYTAFVVVTDECVG